MSLTSTIYLLLISFWRSFRVEAVLFLQSGNLQLSLKLVNICLHVLERVTDQTFACIIPFALLPFFLILLRLHEKVLSTQISFFVLEIQAEQPPSHHYHLLFLQSTVFQVQFLKSRDHSAYYFLPIY